MSQKHAQRDTPQFKVHLSCNHWCICIYNMVRSEWWYSLYPMKPKLHLTLYPCTGTSYYKYTKGGLDFPLCTFHANTCRERKATLTVKREAYTLYSRWCVQFRVECPIIEHTIHVQTHTQTHKESDITDRRGKHKIWPNSYQWECCMQERQTAIHYPTTGPQPRLLLSLSKLKLVIHYQTRAS